jgi:lipoprotein-anchoring transpeptidase ErfK/SrfK
VWGWRRSRGHDLQRRILALIAALLVAGPARAFVVEHLTPQAVNAVTFNEGVQYSRATLVGAQVLLSRARFSPGAIDGERGANTVRALVAFQAARGLDVSGELNQATWEKLVEAFAGPILRPYQITALDAKGPFVPEIPVQFEEQAKLKKLGYTGLREALAERFHMSEALLDALNPVARLDVGVTIMVPNVATSSLPAAERLEVNKSEKLVRVFGAGGALLAVFPASIGSLEKPAPSGSVTIKKVARGPSYTYQPRYAFAGVTADKPFRIPGGPNNPAGTVWIDFGRDGLGIHGTPDPENIGKTASHGCVRLTNWDAEALASAVKKGVTVDFVE